MTTSPPPAGRDDPLYLRARQSVLFRRDPGIATLQRSLRIGHHHATALRDALRGDILEYHAPDGSWRITSACLRNLWRVGTPLAAERAALSSAQVLLVRIVSVLGTVAIAANSLGVSAEGLCYMAGYGIQDASIALIGQAVGAHRRDMAKRFAWFCTAMGMGIISGVSS